MSKTQLTGIIYTAKFGKSPEAKHLLDVAYDSCLKKQTDEEALKLCQELSSAFYHIANSLKARQGEGVVEMDNRKAQ